MSTSDYQPLSTDFSHSTFADGRLLGGSDASLKEMDCELTGKGVKVRHGFVIMVETHCHFIREATYDKRIRWTLSILGTHDLASLSRRGYTEMQGMSVHHPGQGDSVASLFNEHNLSCEKDNGPGYRNLPRPKLQDWHLRSSGTTT